MADRWLLVLNAGSSTLKYELFGPDETTVARGEVGLCGQAPSNDPEFARLLVEAGIDSISVTPDRFVAVKQQVTASEAAMAANARTAAPA